MGQDSKIIVELNNKIQGAQNQINTLKNSGATRGIKDFDTQTEALITLLKELGKISKPTNREIASMVKHFNDLTDLIVKASKNIEIQNKALEEEEKSLKNLYKQREETIEQETAIAKNLSKDKSGVSRAYVKREIGELTYGSNSKYRGKNVGVDSFISMGQRGDFSSLSNPSLAAKIYEEIGKNNNLLPQKYTSLQNQEKELTSKIEAQEAQIEAKGKVTISGEAFKNALNFEALANEARRENIAAANSTLNSRDEEGIGNLQVNSASIGRAVRQVALFRIALRALQKAGREALRTLTELDKSLTEQAMVTGKTREQTYALLKSYQEMAGQLGATTKEVAEVATQFMRQGKSTQEALTLTEAAVSAAKVAGISATESVNYLTTALNGFQLSAENAMAVSDKFAAVAAVSATSYDELATALSKVASQANLAAMSIDYTTAILAKGIETTREAPETIGTALKTVIARMREMGDFGETLEGDTDINNVEKQLSYVGIALRETNGELRSTEEVLDELGRKWDTLNTNQQAAVAKALAGTRQQARLIAMMTDYERVTELQEISMRSQGATLAQMSKYLEGMDASVNKVRVAWEKVTTSLLKAEGIIKIVDSFGTLIESISVILETSVGRFVTLTGLATTLLITSFQSFKVKAAEVGLEKIKTLENAKQVLASGELTTLDFILIGLGIKKISQEKIITAEKEAQVAVEYAALGLIGLILVGLAAVAVAIVFIVKKISKLLPSVENVSKAIDELSSQIYELNKRASELESIADQFDNIDKKVIKTNEDLKEMDNLLEKAADSMSEDQQKEYKKLTTNRGRRDYINKVVAESRAAEEKARKEQYKQYLRNKDVLKTNSDWLFASNNKELQNSIDAMKARGEVTQEYGMAVEKLTQSILEELDAEQAITYLQDPSKVEKLANAVAKLNTTLSDGTKKGLAEILTSDSSSIKERVMAYKQMSVALGKDKEVYEAFGTVYEEYKVFERMSESAIDFIDTAGLSIDQLNNLYLSYEKLQKLGLKINEDIYQSSINQLLENLGEGSSVTQAIDECFSHYLDQIDTTTEEGQQLWETSWNQMVNIVENAMGQSLLNIGQNIDKINNSVNNVYETAAKWATMSENDKTQYLTENADMFAGEGGLALKQAFQSGNYVAIEKALKNNVNLRQRLSSQIAEIDRQLQIEEARVGNDRNEAYIDYLKEWKKKLQDNTNVFKADLSLLVDQEQKQLDIYKEYLEKQQEELEDSLEKRKEAYEKYFDAINKQEEDADFDKQESTLISNLTKLATSTDATSLKSAKDLTNQLEKLEEDRLQTLRERAQEAITQNIENEVSEINDKFDKLLNSNQLLLEAMMGDLANPSAFMSKVLGSNMEGMTSFQAQQYIQDTFNPAFGSVLGNSSLEGIKVEERNGNIYMSLTGTNEEIVLSDSQNNLLYTTIMNLLKQMGVR